MSCEIVDPDELLNDIFDGKLFKIKKREKKKITCVRMLCNKNLSAASNSHLYPSSYTHLKENQTIQLSSHHEEFLENYMKFRKIQRSEVLKTTAASFKDVQSTRLFEETYSKEEVEDLLGNLCDSVITDIEGELIHATHTNCVILNSIFKQAQRWHLELNLDLSEAEDQKKLLAIKNFEESGIGKKDGRRKSQLAPIGDLNSHGPIALLENHIKELTEENNKLQQELELEKSKVDEISRNFQKHILDSNPEKEIIEIVPHPETEANYNKMINKIEQFKEEISSTRSDTEKLEQTYNEELNKAQQSLEQVQSQLTLAEKELEKKFSKTGAYQNMQKMLKSKNDQIKILRQHLLTHEPNFEMESSAK